MFRSFLSWRYLVRRPTNLIGIVGIFVAVGALILILSIMTGFLEESRKTVRGTLADVILTPIQGETTVGGVVPRDPEALLAAVRADARVVAAAPELLWMGVVNWRGKFTRLSSDPGHYKDLAVLLSGVDVCGAARLAALPIEIAVRWAGGIPPRLVLQDELDATAFLHSLIGDVPGQVWTLEPPNPLFPFVPRKPRRYGRPLAGALIGEQMFTSLGLQTGDVIELGTVVPDPTSGELRPNNRQFVVTGTFRTRENEADSSRIYLDRRELADFVGHTQEYSQVLVRLADYERDGGPLTESLRTTLLERGLIAGHAQGRYEVRTWEEFRENLLGAIENERVLMGIMLSLVLVVAGFTIFAILSMMVTEKRRDIGVLAALGAPPRGILSLFLWVAFWDALLGAVLGAVIGTWGAIEIDSIERWLSRHLGIEIFNRSVYLFDHIPAVVEPLWVGTIVLGAFLCALYFAARPAVRAARLDPLEALRYE